MLHEHAITYKDQLSLTDLDYILRKANKLGMNNKHLVYVHQETDKEGTHLYFNIENKNENHP